MFEDHNDSIYEILKSAPNIDSALLMELRENFIQTGKSLADSSIDGDLLKREELLKMSADYLDCEYDNDLPEFVPTELAEILTPSVALMYGVIPDKVTENSVTFFAVDPFNGHIISDLTFKLNKDVILKVADPDKVEKLLNTTYEDENASVGELLGEIGSGFDVKEEGISDNELSDLANQTPIIRFVNLVLKQAIKDKASDVHFEPYEDMFRIRYRIDGALYEMAPPPKNLAVPVISRIKVLSNMNISENRIPQDGRIKMTIAGRPVDLRVSTLPTAYGESVVLRILDKSVVNLDLEALSLPTDIMNSIRDLVVRPNGIFVVTGPTGSGKTTTLYSALREVNQVDTKILTAEDPVEYEVDGIMQVAVNHQVGLDFSKALRSFLRQDPDKIMIGEIRDLETAQIAVQASLTGHVVLSTLHTNDAPGAVTRLIDMGLEPFLISASLEAVLAQRLVRRICRKCRRSYEPSQDIMDVLDVDPLEIADKNFYFGEGCEECSQTGYKGRIGLFEMIMVSDSIRDLINNRAPTLQIRQKALEQGMRGLRDDGLRSTFDGNTTIEEVLKYT
ncbi:MAG: putative type II secretion system protein HxcR [Puniceicoccaceae bacterium MED-G32]|jgi:type IV pilus assembly protein PilB|nr:pilus assembly protein PilB [Puniceicoccaceae bacterium]CAI8282609.1 MAG: putative type II secretion system protein HxcR [Puniceicoccaceae bacterium MED-G32]|tara:strand:- start:2634 stop:4322 length:1689 start_codon:yes stop_codon:yes gene_type:complete